MKIYDVGTHLKRGICGEDRSRRLETDSQSVDFFIIFVIALVMFTGDKYVILTI